MTASGAAGALLALEDVIREAVTDFAAKKIKHVVHGGPPPPDFNDHIAAAVRAHLLSEAVVERAGRGMRKATTGDDMWSAMLPHMRRMWCKHARAALAAAIDAPGGTNAA